MAAELAPAEILEETFGVAVPLPIAPVNVAPRLTKYGKDDHHRLFHRNDPLLKTPDLPEQELDELRVPHWAGLQYGSRWLHQRYHDFYPEGAVLPADEHQRFAISVLFSARYVSPYAVDVSTRRPKVVSVNQAMAAQLQSEGVLHQQTDRHWAIGWFFGRYILRHGLQSVINSEVMSRFVDETTSPAERLRLGFRIISNAAEVVLDPLEPVYQRARAEGQISLESPATARRFLMRHFDQRQPDYFDTIRNMALAA